MVYSVFYSFVCFLLHSFQSEYFISYILFISFNFLCSKFYVRLLNVLRNIFLSSYIFILLSITFNTRAPKPVSKRDSIPLHYYSSTSTLSLKGISLSKFNSFLSFLFSILALRKFYYIHSLWYYKPNTSFFLT